ncbi:hypothetical protein FRC01_008113 [Tulasnella sp. 417]|nr:hypothetical protein FRC01_008113 [Tulasnella sp. 417]
MSQQRARYRAQRARRKDPKALNSRRKSDTDASYMGDVVTLRALANLMTEESTSNRVWCNILSTYYFPFPEYMIKPEARLGGSGHRPDLLVTRSRDSKVVMIIEGKKAGGAQATWDRTVKQLSRYFSSVKKLGLGETPVFGMAAVGRKVVFVAPKGDDAGSVLWGIKVQRETVMSFQGFKTLDIVEDSGEIHALLTHISQSADAYPTDETESPYSSLPPSYSMSQQRARQRAQRARWKDRKPPYSRQSPNPDASYVNDVTVFQRIADLMTEESTNAPLPKSGVSGHRADLLVMRLCDSKVVMIIEGKKAGGAQATWDKAVKQSSRYFNLVKELGVGAAWVFGMAAVGKKVVFVAPNGVDAEGVLWGIKVQRGKPMSFRGIKALDIVEDSGEIHAMLTHISETAHLTPGHMDKQLEPPKPDSDHDAVGRIRHIRRMST